MKRISVAILLMACLVAPSVYAQASVAGKTISSFEGVVNTETTVSGQKYDMTTYIKDGITRIEMNMHGMSSVMINDLAGKKMTRLMPSMKKYMTMSIPSTMPMQKPDTNFKLVKTGKTESILGHSCDEWVSTNTSTKETTSMWLAKGLGISSAGDGGNNMTGQGSSAFEPMLKEGGYYPLRTVMKDASGKEIFRSDVTKIEKKSLEASLFQVPSDYKEMPMPAGMGHMMGGGGSNR